jgi:hypothetical protein
VIAVGASLTYYTVDGGNLFPKAYVAQIGERPLGLNDGGRAGDLHVKADAKAAVETLTRELKANGATKANVRSPKLAQRIANASRARPTYALNDATQASPGRVGTGECPAAQHTATRLLPQARWRHFLPLRLRLHLSPLAGRGRRAALAASRVRGALHILNTELVEIPPHPNPLPAGEERERTEFAALSVHDCTNTAT